jgi:hypothetical protein
MCSNRLAIRTQREESARTRSSAHVIGFMIAVGKAVKHSMPKGGQLALSEGGDAGTVHVTG